MLSMTVNNSVRFANVMKLTFTSQKKNPICKSIFLNYLLTNQIKLNLVLKRYTLYYDKSSLRPFAIFISTLHVLYRPFCLVLNVLVKKLRRFGVNTKTPPVFLPIYQYFFNQILIDSLR